MLRELDGWLKTGNLDEVKDKNGQLRYSPRAIRLMAHKISSGFGDVSDRSSRFIFPWRWEALGYLRFTGVLRNLMDDRNFMLTPGDVVKREWRPGRLTYSNRDSRFRNVVLGSIESAAEAVGIIRSEKPDVTVVFDHMKSNGFPHSGYTIGWFSSMNMLRKRHINESDVVWVRACDTNMDISQAGSVPFLNTRWRKSLHSYLPIDIVSSSGDYHMSDADDYWAEMYRTINSDYLVAVRGDPNTPQKFDRIRKMRLSTKILLRSRLGDERSRKTSVSQRTLRTFDYDLSLGLGSSAFIASQYEQGAFHRTTNWRQFLDERGFFG